MRGGKEEYDKENFMTKKRSLSSSTKTIPVFGDKTSVQVGKDKTDPHYFVLYKFSFENPSSNNNETLPLLETTAP
jgi:hypothetical protein